MRMHENAWAIHILGFQLEKVIEQSVIMGD